MKIQMKLSDFFDTFVLHSSLILNSSLLILNCKTESVSWQQVQQQ